MLLHTYYVEQYVPGELLLNLYRLCIDSYGTIDFTMQYNKETAELTIKILKCQVQSNRVCVHVCACVSACMTNT